MNLIIINFYKLIYKFIPIAKIKNKIDNFNINLAYKTINNLMIPNPLYVRVNTVKRVTPYVIYDNNDIDR